MKVKAIFYFLLLVSITSYSQDPLKSNYQKNKKGTFYFYWGYNRDWYSNSDIHFEGEDYDFELKDVIANDRQQSLVLKSIFFIMKILRFHNITLE